MINWLVRILTLRQEVKPVRNNSLRNNCVVVSTFSLVENVVCKIQGGSQSQSHRKISYDPDSESSLNVIAYRLACLLDSCFCLGLEHLWVSPISDNT